MDYEGIIIEESLTNLDILKELEIVHTEIEKVTESLAGTGHDLLPDRLQRRRRRRHRYPAPRHGQPGP